MELKNHYSREEIRILKDFIKDRAFSEIMEKSKGKIPTHQDMFNFLIMYRLYAKLVDELEDSIKTETGMPEEPEETDTEPYSMTFIGTDGHTWKGSDLTEQIEGYRELIRYEADWKRITGEDYDARPRTVEEELDVQQKIADERASKATKRLLKALFGEKNNPSV